MVETLPDQKVNLLALMGCQGFICAHLLHHSTRGTDVLDFFLAFINVIPPHHVIIMDNHPMHHGEVEEFLLTLFHTKNILLFFVPPYRHDLSPIECGFGTLKHYLKEVTPQWNPDVDIPSHLGNITSEQCTAWFHHCGYF